MKIQPTYRPGVITGVYMDPSVFRVLTKTQLDMLRFLECVLLSPDHATEMLRVVKGIGSRLNLDIASYTIINSLFQKLTNVAKNKYELKKQFFLGYFNLTQKPLIRSITSEFIFQILKGVHMYYSEMQFSDFEHVLTTRDNKLTYWTSDQSMSPLEILLTSYIIYFTDFFTHYSSYVTDIEHNLVAKVFFGHVSKPSDFVWEADISIPKPESFAEESFEEVYNTLSDTEEDITAPLTFSAYLSQLKMTALSPDNEQNATKLKFLQDPMQYIYEAFLGVSPPPKKKKRLNTDEDENEDEQEKSNPKKKSKTNKEINDEDDINSETNNGKHKIKLHVEALDTFLAHLPKGTEENVFKNFFTNPSTFPLVVNIMEELITNITLANQLKEESNAELEESNDDASETDDDNNDNDDDHNDKEDNEENDENDNNDNNDDINGDDNEDHEHDSNDNGN